MAEKKYKPFYANVVLGARCAKCGRDFTKRHPKDDETLCEECRKERACQLGMAKKTDM